jgi:hypothetical protein
MFCRKDIRKAYQIREKESICNAVYLKDPEDKDHNEYALPLDVFEMIAKSINNVLDYLHFRAGNKLLRLAALYKSICTSPPRRLF